MEVLDGDVVRLSSRGREAERDIVQVSNEISFLNSVISIFITRDIDVTDLHILCHVVRTIPRLFGRP